MSVIVFPGEKEKKEDELDAEWKLKRLVPESRIRI